MIDVLVVDDHPVVRAGLVALVSGAGDLRVVGEAGDGEEAVRLGTRPRPDVVLMDLSMPVLDGVGATRQLLAEHPRQWWCSPRSPTRRASRTRSLPAPSGTCSRTATRATCSPPSALPRRATPRSTLGSRAACCRVRRPRRSPVDGLSQREREVLQLVAQGMANKQVGRPSASASAP